MLNKAQIKTLIDEQKLIEEAIDVSRQLTVNGFDVTAGGIFSFNGGGALDFSNKERVVPQGKEILPIKRVESDTFGWWTLQPGAYKIRTNEIVNLPTTLVALSFTRTSLLRMGAFTQNGVWDAGFQGRGEFILIVSNPAGVAIKQNARLVQMVFIPVEETQEYEGVYKHLK